MEDASHKNKQCRDNYNLLNIFPLTLKAPITTPADDNILLLLFFMEKKSTFYVNRLPSTSHMTYQDLFSTKKKQ